MKNLEKIQRREGTVALRHCHCLLGRIRYILLLQILHRSHPYKGHRVCLFFVVSMLYGIAYQPSRFSRPHTTTRNSKNFFDFLLSNKPSENQHRINRRQFQYVNFTREYCVFHRKEEDRNG